jgi:hypothetical protein
MPLTQFIHITAQYSNAVLLATLPHVSDFAKNLNLPVPLPITTNHVQRFQPERSQGHVGGWLILTNGFQFWYERGNVHIFETPRNFYNAQDPDKISEFYGPLKMNKKEAIQIARDTIKKLGYSEKTFTDGWKLNVEGPPHIKTNTIPFYRVEWVDPKDNESASARFDIDAENKRVVGLYYSNRNRWHPEPKIDVPVELESDYQKRMRGPTNLIYQTNAPQKLLKSAP